MAVLRIMISSQIANILRDFALKYYYDIFMAMG